MCAFATRVISYTHAITGIIYLLVERARHLFFAKILLFVLKVRMLLMQADFASIHVTASSDGGAVVDILLNRHGTNAVQLVIFSIFLY